MPGDQSPMAIVRYTHRPFPSYRFVPGRSPHPRRDPLGHSYGQPESKRRDCSSERWFDCEDYLYGVDLYNFGYWWESHEVFEALWHGAGRSTMEGQFFRAVIQIAAANLKRAMGCNQPARRLCHRGLDRLAEFPGAYMGLDVAAFAETVRDSFSDSRGTPVPIRLAVPAEP